MKIIEVKESLKNLYDDFVKKSFYAGILQSYCWGEFQKKFGRQIFRNIITESELIGGKNGFLTSKIKVRGSFLAVKKELPFGKNYLHLVYGPLIGKGENKEKIFRIILEKLKEIGEKENSLFIKIEPNFEFDFSRLDFIASESIHPKNSLILDISGEDESILKNMKQKTRYNIRLSQRRGVKVKKSANIEEIDEFYRLANLTAKKQKISLHPKKYYEKMLSTLAPEGMMDLFLAYFKGKIIAAALIGYFFETATYLHGGSDPAYQSTMASSLLQWQGILYAKDKNCKYYDFFGIAPRGAINHPWAGISRFKRGFAPEGREIHLPGAFDLPLKGFSYKMYKLLKKAKSIF